MNHQRNVINVNTSSSNVCRHEGNGPTFRESGEILHSSGLREVAMHLNGRNAGEIELFGELLRPTLHLGEHNRFPRSRSEVHQNRQSVLGRDVEDEVIHRGHRRLRRINTVRDWVREIPLHEHFNPVVQRCREQHSLADLRSLIHETLH
jgi:hypothetical protein